jgi:dihydrofolate reductase
MFASGADGMTPAMRKLILKMEQSIDGFIGRHGPDDPDWLYPFYDAELTDYALGLLSSAGVHAMGRATYAAMASHWPRSDEPFARPMNEIPKVVVSTTLRVATWPTTTICRSLRELTALKEVDGGPIIAYGGARFAQALTREDLIDEYRLNVHPVALHDGVRLFGSEARLTLTAARSFPRGAVALTYTR